MRDLYNYFKNTSNTDDHEEYEINNIDMSNDDNCLNAPITEEEISKCINQLANNKSPGIDNILNEFIKHTQIQFLPLYKKLFNLVLNNGCVPTTQKRKL